MHASSGTQRSRPVYRRDTSQLELIEEALELLPDTNQIYTTWRDIVLRYNVRGKQVHDARIAASLRVHSIRMIVTWNVSDFRRYDWITPITPDLVLASG